MSTVIDAPVSGLPPDLIPEQDAFALPERLFEQLPDAIYVCDRDGLILRYNRRAAALWGREPALNDPTQRYCGSLRLYGLDGGPLPHDQCPMADVLRSGVPTHDREIVVERPDGSRAVALVNIEPLKDARGRVAGAVNCFRDITERKRIEDELRAAQRKLTEGEQQSRAILDGLDAAIYTTDAQGRITYYNEAAVTFSGRRPKLGSDEWCVTWKLYRPDGTPLPHDQCPMAITLREKRPVRGMEAVAERPDGTRVPFIPYPTPIFDENGELTGAVNMLVDISERKQTELGRNLLAAVVESSTDAIVSKTLDGIVSSWNTGAERLFGYTAEEMIGRPILTVIPDDRKNEERVILERLQRGERIDHFETVRRHKDGHLVDVSLNISPVRNEKGEIIGASKIARDITERKRTEAALRESRARLSAELEATKQLQDISAQLIHEDGTEALYEKLIDAAALIMRSDYASMQMLYPERGSGGELRLLAFRGFNPQAAKFWEWVRADSESTCGVALRSGQRVVVADVGQCDFMAGTDDLETYLRTGIHAVQSTPLVSRSGRLLGMISTHWRTPHTPSETDLLRLDVLARQAADLIERAQAVADLRTQTNRFETLNQVSKAVSSKLGLRDAVQTVTDLATRLSGARFGAFFYNENGQSGERYQLYTLSGAPREAFETFEAPRNTALFAPTFRGEGIVRSDDIRKDPRYGQNAPHFGMPKGHLPVTSYLAVPVFSRSGNVIGGLFFGHDRPGVFTEETENVVSGIAAHAAIAIDNARLFETLRQREQERELLVGEIKHRIKNTLATVQAIAAQTFRAAPADQRRAFEERLSALARTQDLLTSDRWDRALIQDVAARALLPFQDGRETRIAIDGPDAWVDGKNALLLTMVLHELATNATKYGALSNGTGNVRLSWERGDNGGSRRATLCWKEDGGPAVTPPAKKGFGSRLIEQALTSDFGKAQLDFAPDGIVWRFEMPVQDDAAQA